MRTTYNTDHGHKGFKASSTREKKKHAIFQENTSFKKPTSFYRKIARFSYKLRVFSLVWTWHGLTNLHL